MPETIGSAAAKVLRSFRVLSGALSFCQRLGSGPLRTRASPWDLSGTWIFAEPRGKARETCENRALLTYRGMGCNIAKPRQNGVLRGSRWGQELCGLGRRMLPDHVEENIAVLPELGFGDAV